MEVYLNMDKPRRLLARIRIFRFQRQRENPLLHIWSSVLYFSLSRTHYWVLQYENCPVYPRICTGMANITNLILNCYTV